MRAVVIAGTASGVGKTTIATGLMGALVARGQRVQGFKVGPDYIDPAYHSRVTGRPSRNLDSWLLPTATLRAAFGRAVASADVAVVEGVMGLYDGRHGGGAEGSTAEVARLLDLPVVLVVDASRQARSAAATVLGFQRFDPAVHLVGVILNRVGSADHRATVTEAIQAATGLPVLGALSRADALRLPERYLGLVPPYERAVADEFFAQAAAAVAREIDVDRLLALAACAPPPPAATLPDEPRADQSRPLLAVARDRAFGFYYADALDLLCAEGLALAEFSPLADAALPAGTCGVYIGGGFPELFAADLAANRPLLRELRAAARRGLPIYGECGGLMYLGRTLIDRDGAEHTLAGLIPATTSLRGARLSLGYRTARSARDSLLLHTGESVRAHEFHYSRWSVGRGAPAAYAVAGREPAEEGYARGNVLGSYLHLHLAGAPALARRFVAACRAWQGAAA